jgi:hypothetical protein
VCAHPHRLYFLPQSDHGKCILPGLIVRRDVVVIVEIPLVDLLAQNERVNFNSVVALDPNGIEFIIIYWDVSVLRVFVPAPLMQEDSSRC